MTLQDIKFLRPKDVEHPDSAMGINQNDPNTMYIVTNPKWFTIEKFDYKIKSGINHESIHSTLIKMNMKKESSKFDRIYWDWKDTQTKYGFFDKLF